MAEILGTVSSALAVAEVGLKVVGTMLELKKLWEEVQEVPETIRHLMTELQILEPLLEDIGSQDTQISHIQSETSTRLSSSYCQAALAELRILVDKLSQDINSKKRRAKYVGRVKVVLAKGDITKAEARLSRAVALLQSSQMNYLISLTRRQPDVIMERFTAFTTVSRSGCDAIEPIAQDGHTPTHENGNASQEASWTQTKACAKDRMYAARLRLPLWLCSRVWEVVLHKATSGWQVNITIANIVPEDSLVFKFASEGNSIGLRKLFDDGLASPLDRSVDGKTTLLYEACCAGQLQIVNEYFPLFRHDDLETYRSVNTLIQKTPSMSVNMDTFRILLGEGLIDMWYERHRDSPASRGYFFWWRMSYASHHDELFHFILNRLQLSFSAADFEGLFRFLMNRPFGMNYWSAKMVRQLLWPDKVAQKDRILYLKRAPSSHIDDLEDPDDAPLTLLSVVAVRYGYCVSKYGGPLKKRNFPHWRQWLKDIVALSEELSPEERHDDRMVDMFWLSDCLLTPLQRMLLGVDSSWHSSRSFKSTLNEAIRRWVRDLGDCGVDLRKYGKREARLLEQNSKLRNERWGRPPSQRSESWPKLKAIKYGADPEDWSLVWDEEVEEFAGEFWDMLDNEMPRVPGAWVDD